MKLLKLFTGCMGFNYGVHRVYRVCGFFGVLGFVHGVYDSELRFRVSTGRGTSLNTPKILNPYTPHPKP